MHMARHLEFMALSWVRLGRASFLTSVPQFWAEKSKSSTVVQFQHIPRQKSRRCIKKVVILLRRQMTYEFTSHFVSTRRKLLRPISERLVSTKCTFFLSFRRDETIGNFRIERPYNENHHFLAHFWWTKIQQQQFRLDEMYFSIFDVIILKVCNV